MTERCRRLAIIGAGFTGTALAVQLMRRSIAPMSILLFDRAGAFGPGLAYGTMDENHRLNVRAAKMSLFEEEPDHFVGWLARNERETGESDAAQGGAVFCLRKTYGRYLRDSLAAAMAAPSCVDIDLLPAEVTALGTARDGVRLTLADGRCFFADAAILCSGNPAPARLRWARAPHISARIVHNPWEGAALDAIGPDNAVALLGTGLTTIDVALTLAARGHRAPLMAISRHGMLPRSHAAATPPPPRWRLDVRPHTAVACLRQIRTAVERAGGGELDWRAIVDAIHPDAQKIWCALPEDERRRFLRHLRRHWDVHRHRMAPHIATQIETLCRNGQLTVVAGRVDRVEREGEGLVLSVRSRNGDASIIAADWIVNCTGPADYRSIDDRLIRQLYCSGIARPDPLGLGIEVTPDCRIVAGDGAAVTRLYALGPPTRGAFWEITSVPDIRKQCGALAKALADEVALSDAAVGAN